MMFMIGMVFLALGAAIFYYLFGAVAAVLYVVLMFVVVTTSIYVAKGGKWEE